MGREGEEMGRGKGEGEDGEEGRGWRETRRRKRRVGKRRRRGGGRRCEEGEVGEQENGEEPVWEGRTGSDGGQFLFSCNL